MNKQYLTVLGLTRALLFVSLTLSSVPSLAKTELRHNSLLGLRANPSGLALKTTAQLRMGLYESDSKLFAQNFVAPTMQLTISPANTKVGAGLIVQPLSVLAVYGEAVGIYYFGSFHRLQSFPVLTDDHSKEAQLERSAQDLNYAAAGLQLVVGGRFQMKAGPLALVASARGIWQDFRINEQDLFFYESELDILAPDRGWVFHSDIDAVYFWGEDLILGMRHTYVSPQYPQEFEATEPRPKPNHRLGPLFGWKLRAKSDEPARVEEIMLLGLVNWYLDHTYRAGQTSHRAIPYVAIGLRMSGELWSVTPSL